MEVMKNKKLKELLSTYPDDSFIRIRVNGNYYNIKTVSIEYMYNDDMKN